MATSAGARLRGVSHRYSADTWALHDIDLELTPGVTALVGENGAGKSTLLSTLAGSLRPTSGSVEVGGIDLFGHRRRHALPRVALMPQTLTLPEDLTVLEAVSVIGWMRGLNGRTAQSKAAVALQAVHLEDRAHDKVKRLSGGMKRRIALAQAIVAEPNVLLLDEPSTGLDPRQRRRMVDIVTTLEGTVLFSSHVMEDVVETADRVIVLHHGRIVFDGDTGRLQSLAPESTAPSRRAEAAFLRLLDSSESLRT